MFQSHWLFFSCTFQLQLRGVVEYHQQYMLDWLGTPMMWRGGDYALPDELRVPYPVITRNAIRVEFIGFYQFVVLFVCLFICLCI